jgi:single-strand DNA-binding protein
MSRSMNKIFVLGHVGRDPEVRKTSGGTKVAHLSIATNHFISNGGDTPVERTEWHRVTLWSGLAALAEEYIRKGDRILVEGRLEYDAYERDGVTIPTAEIHAREVFLLGAPKGAPEYASNGTD